MENKQNFYYSGGRIYEGMALPFISLTRLVSRIDDPDFTPPAGSEAPQYRTAFRNTISFESAIPPNVSVAPGVYLPPDPSNEVKRFSIDISKYPDGDNSRIRMLMFTSKMLPGGEKQKELIEALLRFDLLKCRVLHYGKFLVVNEKNMLLAYSISLTLSKYLKANCLLRRENFFPARFEDREYYVMRPDIPLCYDRSPLPWLEAVFTLIGAGQFLQMTLYINSTMVLRMHGKSLGSTFQFFIGDDMVVEKHVRDEYKVVMTRDWTRTLLRYLDDNIHAPEVVPRGKPIFIHCYIRTISNGFGFRNFVAFEPPVQFRDGFALYTNTVEFIQHPDEGRRRRQEQYYIDRSLLDSGIFPPPNRYHPTVFYYDIMEVEHVLTGDQDGGVRAMINIRELGFSEDICSLDPGAPAP